MAPLLRALVWSLALFVLATNAHAQEAVTGRVQRLLAQPYRFGRRLLNEDNQFARLA